MEPEEEQPTAASSGPSVVQGKGHTPYRPYTPEELEDVRRRADADPPTDPDPPKTYDVDPGVLDFHKPWPLPLDDPDGFSVSLHGVAEMALSRGQLEASFLSFVPLIGRLPEERQKQLGDLLLQFLADVRLAGGQMALYQPSIQVTERQKRRAIIPAAPAVLRLDEWAAEIQEAIAVAPDDVWGAVPSVAQGPMTLTFQDGLSMTAPQSYPHVVGHGEGDRDISYGLALKLELGTLRRAIAKVCGVFGSFDFWVKQPRRAAVDGLFRALQARECDYQEFLVELQREIGLPDTTFYRGELARIVLSLDCMKDASSSPHWREKSEADLFGYLDHKVRDAVRNKNEFKHVVLGGSKVQQFSAIDELTRHGGLFNPGLRWAIRVQWEQVADELDARTAAELRKVLDGATVADLGEANYKHFQRALPRIRAIAYQLRVSPSTDPPHFDESGRVPELAAGTAELDVTSWRWPDREWENDPSCLRNFLLPTAGDVPSELQGLLMTGHSDMPPAEGLAMPHSMASPFSQTRTPTGPVVLLPRFFVKRDRALPWAADNVRPVY
jgi:hypothetical protein